ncbi:hypothetical protein MTO96_015504 [Rhipicephalus appendiculatus]
MNGAALSGAYTLRHGYPRDLGDQPTLEATGPILSAGATRSETLRAYRAYGHSAHPPGRKIEMKRRKSRILERGREEGAPLTRLSSYYFSPKGMAGRRTESLQPILRSLLLLIPVIRRRA